MTTVKVGCRTPWSHGEGAFPAAHVMASEKRCRYSTWGGVSGARVKPRWEAGTTGFGSMVVYAWSTAQPRRGGAFGWLRVVMVGGQPSSGGRDV